MLHVLNKIASKFGYVIVSKAELDKAIADVVTLKRDITDLQELYVEMRVQRELEKRVVTLHPN